MQQGNQATDLYTKEQRDYVNNIPDTELRHHLLHQIRLRDNLRADRDAFEKQAAEWPSIQKAMERLIKELSADKSHSSYYHSWVANIAMAFKDEFYKYAHDNGILGTAGNFNVHAIANNAAKSFLDVLCSKDEPTK